MLSSARRWLHRTGALLLVGMTMAASCTQTEPPTPSGSDTPNAWRVHRAEEGVDHPAEIMLTRRALASTARLTIGCLDEETVVYVLWPEALGADSVAVRIRLDDRAAQHARWQVSTDGWAAGLWSDSASVPLLRDLYGAAQFTVRAERDSVEALEAHFRLD